jgi:alkyl sulfatase BDS1-like metallo-beta-lactamase superfamily hydrolase
VAVLACGLTACSRPPASMKVEANPSLAQLSSRFRKEVIEVTEGIHVAVGYGLANSILLEGNNGVVVVDTMESAEAARPVKAAFDRITDKPVKAIIYTHNHADHVFGARVFAGSDRPKVIAHRRTLAALDRILSVIRPAIYKRSMRQFGTLLPREGVVNAGIGPRLRFDNKSTIALLRPSQTFAGERQELEIAGLKLVLVHAPGETDDQIFIWLPRRRVLLPADNFYWSFPNLYAIRGTAYRDVMHWVHSLDVIRALRPRFLVPSHGRPLSGEEKIFEVLTNYRDAIQFVHDQTVRGMNQGLTPDQLVQRVRLPEHLAHQPYLQEYYGTVAWSVRAIFAGYLGWFDGNATNLFPLPRKDRARRLADLAGGVQALLGHAQRAAAARDHQWALELADQVLVLEPDHERAREIRSAAMIALGQRQISANARNYYLTQAQEAEGALTIGTARTTQTDAVHNIPLEAIFKAMTVSLDPVQSARTDCVVGFRFPDVNKAFTVHVRRGVAEVQHRFPDRPTVSVTMPAHVWKEIAAKIASPVMAYFTEEIEVEGSLWELIQVLRMFKAD